MAMTPFARALTRTLTIAAVGLVPAAVLPVQAQSGSDLVYEVQELLEEMRELRGQVEAQQHEIENLLRRQREQYLDLDRRLQALEQGDSVPAAEQSRATARAVEPVRPVSGSAGPESLPDEVPADVPEVRAPIDAPSEITSLARPSTAPPRELESVSEEEKAAYDRAFRALRETRYADAAEGFNGFLHTWPDSPYAPNAQYWLAETYYVTRDFDVALSYFTELRQRYPDSDKQGDALLKIGFCHYELQRWNEARAALEQVRSEHPGTTLARLAEGRLRDMRLAGHY